MALPELDQLPTTFSYRQAIAAGITHHHLYSLRDSGELEQVGRGLYRKAAAELADLDLLEAAQRAPRATICLLSALARHDLTDAIPGRYDLALPRDAWHPRLGPILHWHSFDRTTFHLGRTSVPVDDTTTIGLYDAPRTIVDSIRLRNMLGSDVANEALRRWLRNGGQPAKLITVARAFPRAMPALMNALEVLL
ncbi:MAG: type IV toxin-antitoxin system AbiEi family antitoxin domain-containing protein [Jatrophihabitantaceae bacterium]